MNAVPLNPNDAVLQLAKLVRLLDETTRELNRADMLAVKAVEVAKLAEAQAFLSAQGAMDLRKRIAIVDTHEARLAAEVAEAIVRGLQRDVRTLQARIDVGRTFSATVRSEVALAGSGVNGS